MFVFYGISATGAMSVGRFGWTDELSESPGANRLPEEYDEVWCVDLGELVRFGDRLPRDAVELVGMGYPCCRECGDAGDVYNGACGHVVWCDECAADLLPLLEVE